ncbi:MAG: VOC family protein [Promethearchaeota archaeon]
MGKEILIIDHVAVSANSEEESDKFFVSLLGLKKDKVFTVSKNLMEKFFGIKKDQQIIRYSSEKVNIEAFITNKKNKIKGKFTHICFSIEDRNHFLSKAEKMMYKVIRVAREGSDNYYLFVKDAFGNLYEIKSP